MKGAGKRKLVSSDEAEPARGQHQQPCADCPWAREALPGWTGGIEPETWLQAAHGEERIECHTLVGAQCAGAAIYRRNVCKMTHDPANLVLPVNRDKVFASPVEFLAHHKEEAWPSGSNPLMKSSKLSATARSKKPTKSMRP